MGRAGVDSIVVVLLNMKEKIPKPVDKDERTRSVEIADKELTKIRRILSGGSTMPPRNTDIDTERKENDTPKEGENQGNKTRDKSLPVKGGTWHDDYDNY